MGTRFYKSWEQRERRCLSWGQVVLDLGRRPEARFLNTHGGEYLREAVVRAFWEHDYKGNIHQARYQLQEYSFAAMLMA